MITGLDHVLLVCPSLDEAENCYTNLLGREPDWRSSDPGGSATIIYQLENTALEIMSPTGGGPLADGQKLYADIKGRMEKIGRNPEHLKILPGAFVVVDDTIEKPAKNASSSTASSTTKAPSPPSRSRSASTHQHSTPTAPCPRSPRPTRAKAAASASCGK